MRKLAAALLAVPVLALIYVPVMLRRSIVARVGMALGVGSIVAVGAFGLITPGSTVATPPLPPIVPLASAAFNTTIAAGTELDTPVSISFSAPMDRASVGAALDVDPAVSVDMVWDSSDTKVTIKPKGGWSAATYHTITVRAGALGASGRPMGVPARAVFLTRKATAGQIEATALSGSTALVSTAFKISFDHPVEVAAVRDSLTIDPPLEGTIEATEAAAGTSAFLFTPATLLAPATTYRLALANLVDASGARLEAIPTIAISTAAAPKVVRFRPLSKATDVPRSQILSIRFSESMDRASAKAAFSASIGGKAIAGKVSFAEKDTVLVFRPAALLPYGAAIEMLVKETATSKLGMPLAAPSSAQVTVEAKPAAKKVPKPSPSSGGSSGSGGSAVGGGSWAAIETFYLKIMNCTRTGGLVTSSGACSSPGGRNVAPLKLDAGISSKVARPYAKKLATSGVCSHFSDGNPGDRLRRAGYTSYIWAENLGCRSGSPKGSVLGSHLFFQSERSWSPLGGHYVNLMNAKYDRVGIGVWVSGGRVRLVVDFYRPR